MKTKILTISALVATFLINAAFAGSGSLSVGYGSDLFRRGALIAEDSFQTETSYSNKISGIDFTLGAQTAHSNESSGDVYVLSGGATRTLNDLLSLYAGLEHIESLDGASELDALASVSLNTVLSPTILISRNVDADLYTFELGVSQDLDLKLANVSFNGSVGNTDTRLQDNIDYYSAGISVSKELHKGLDLSVSGDFVDSETINNDFIIGAMISTSF